MDGRNEQRVALKSKTKNQIAPYMDKIKPILITAIIALVAVAIANRISQARKLIGN